MSRVIASATTSLDGFIAHEDHGIDPLFDWYDNGEVAVSSASPDISFRLTPQSAEYWRDFTGRLGSLVVGRELFDLTDGWGDNHPLGVPVVVLTHEPPTDWAHDHGRTTFVTEGIEAAIATAHRLAGDKDVGVAAGTIARQCLEAGLLDEVRVDLVPVVLGRGRPYFGDLAGAPALLGDPTTVVRGERATHLVFPVLKDASTRP